jgi:Domain of unknown function (DUF6089)
MSKLYMPFFAFFLWSSVAQAQGFEAGLSLNATIYNGDITAQMQNLGTVIRPAVGILVKYPFSDKFLLRGQVLVGQLAASEANDPVIWRKERGFTFRTNMGELTGTLEYIVLDKGNMAAFVFGGAGAIAFKPSINFNSSTRFDPDIRSDVGTNYSVAATIPLGVGVKYRMDNNINIAFEIGYRYVSTDYLDGISKVTHPFINDAYIITGFTVTKGFNVVHSASMTSKVKCPKFLP